MVNFVFNCTASDYLFQVNSQNNITIQNMKFDSKSLLSP